MHLWDTKVWLIAGVNIFQAPPPLAPLATTAPAKNKDRPAI